MMNLAEPLIIRRRVALNLGGGCIRSLSGACWAHHLVFVASVLFNEQGNEYWVEVYVIYLALSISQHARHRTHKLTWMIVFAWCGNLVCLRTYLLQTRTFYFVAYYAFDALHLLAFVSTQNSKHRAHPSPNIIRYSTTANNWYCHL